MITTAYLDLPFFFPIIFTAAYPFYYYDILNFYYTFSLLLLLVPAPNASSMQACY